MGQYRKRMNRKQSKKDFSRKADRIDEKNIRRQPMRGGYRL